MKSKRFAVVAVMLAAVGLVAACKKQRPPPNTGVSECDAYIVQYEACIDKMPGVAQKAAEDGLKTQREAFEKSASSSPEAKKALAQSCKQLQETTKSMCP